MAAKRKCRQTAGKRARRQISLRSAATRRARAALEGRPAYPVANRSRSPPGPRVNQRWPDDSPRLGTRSSLRLKTGVGKTGISYNIFRLCERLPQHPIRAGAHNYPPVEAILELEGDESEEEAEEEEEEEAEEEEEEEEEAEEEMEEEEEEAEEEAVGEEEGAEEEKANDDDSDDDRVRFINTLRKRRWSSSSSSSDSSTEGPPFLRRKRKARKLSASEDDETVDQVSVSEEVMSERVEGMGVGEKGLDVPIPFLLPRNKRRASSPALDQPPRCRFRTDGIERKPGSGEPIITAEKDLTHSTGVFITPPPSTSDGHRGDGIIPVRSDSSSPVSSQTEHSHESFFIPPSGSSRDSTGFWDDGEDCDPDASALESIEFSSFRPDHIIPFQFQYDDLQYRRDWVRLEAFNRYVELAREEMERQEYEARISSFLSIRSRR